jgi:hypothetical protein
MSLLYRVALYTFEPSGLVYGESFCVRTLDKAYIDIVPPICSIPAGFDYLCLEDTQPLATTREGNMGDHAVSFGPDMRNLSQICRQIYEEMAVLPFKTYTWSFETAFTLEQWVSMKATIPLKHKNAVRTVAVPAPGPYRSSERILTNLQEVLLIGKPYSTTTVYNASNLQAPIQPVLKLKKDKATDTWVRSGEHARYAKDLFD